MNMLFNIIQYCDINLRTFLYLCNLFWCFNNITGRNSMPLCCKTRNLCIKRLVTHLIFFPTSTPAWIISANLNCHFNSSFYIQYYYLFYSISLVLQRHITKMDTLQHFILYRIFVVSQKLQIILRSKIIILIIPAILIGIDILTFFCYSDLI